MTFVRSHLSAISSPSSRGVCARAPSTRLAAALVLGLATGTLGAACSEGPASTARTVEAGLGIDDGLSSGQTKSVKVREGEPARLKLDNGAELRLPTDAVRGGTTVQLKRPNDDDALALVLPLRTKKDDKKLRLASAPHVIAPVEERTARGVAASVTLPVARGLGGESLAVLYRATEEDDSDWEWLSEASVVDGLVTLESERFGVFVLVPADDYAWLRALADEAGQGQADGGTSTTRPDADASSEDAGDETPDGSVDAGQSLAVLEGDVIDLSLCPSEGCIVRLPSLPDGVFDLCAADADRAQLTSGSFDFASACQNPTRSDGVTYIHNARVGVVGGVLGPNFCAEVPAGVTGSTLYALGTTFGLEGMAGTFMLHIATQDGVTYGWGRPLESSPLTPDQLSVYRLSEEATDALRAPSCSADTEVRTDASVALAYGQAAFGAMPAELRGTTWMQCGFDCAAGSAEYLRFTDDAVVTYHYTAQEGTTGCEAARAGARGDDLGTITCQPNDDGVGVASWGTATVDLVDADTVYFHGEAYTPVTPERAPPSGADTPCAAVAAPDRCVLD